MGDLTKNFSLADFAVSSSYPEEAKKIEFSEADELKAFLLAQFYGEPLIGVLGYRPTSSSGKRTERLNTLLHGGVQVHSGHLWENFEAAWDLGMRTSLDFWNAFLFLLEHSIYGEMIIYLRGKEAFNLHIALPSRKDDPSCGTHDTAVCVEEKGKRLYYGFRDWLTIKGVI